MAKSDARFEYKANLSRTDFDLSQRFGLTLAPGMLMPLWFDFASPGDSYYISHDLPLLRSSVLAQPAMVDVKVHYETFFVPMQMIYQPFEQTMFSLRSAQSNFYGLGQDYFTNNNFPKFDYNDFVTQVINTANPTNDYHADAFRLADVLGLNPINFTGANALDQSQYVPSFFPYQLLAYHTIYQYYYRLDDKTQFQNSYCNWDSYYNNSIDVKMPADFMMVHQRPWNFDYFTSIYRSPIVTDTNTQHLLGTGAYSSLLSNINYNGSKTSPINKYGAASADNSNYVGFSPSLGSSFSQSDLSLGISTAQIRQMFANEKLAMITGRTRKNYDSQVLAHYGVSVPHDVKHDITMIHHDEFDLNVQEVTSLASTPASGSTPATPLGELAGKSYASGNGKQFKFTAPVHGVMMTIISIEPKKRYFGSMFDRCNSITNAFDFPTPEFDRLGNQPMFRYECGMNINNQTFNLVDIVGWKERYYSFKRKYDRLTYAFGFDNPNQNGVNNYAPFMLGFAPFAVNGSSITTVDERPDLENRFYIERNCMDNLCLVDFAFGWKTAPDSSDDENWSKSPWLVYARDPFIVNSFIKAKKVSWMSKDGEPIYNY